MPPASRATLLLFCVLPCATAEDWQPRLRMAWQIAREKNDAGLVRQVERLARDLPAEPAPAAEERLRRLEEAVGIDPGGWSMAGQPLFHPTPEMEARLKATGPQLAAAMASGDVEEVGKVTRQMRAILGPQAGVPDGRRPGRRPPPLEISREGVVRLFFEALESEGGSLRALTQGRPLPDQMARTYAYVLDACVTMHPHAVRHAPARLAALEQLLRGTADLLVRLQQPQGHFPFPDLRGKNIRFGAMIERQLRAGTVEVRDGWIITPDPDGGTQFDTGLCGAALLRAGALLAEERYTAAGHRAAAWAAAQPCCTNFNYNAFSVALLAQAGMREAALEKFRLGLAPGQAENGRWLDAHNARTVYHVIILRALAALGRSPEVDAAARPALRALLDEFDAMGVTVEALPELLALSAQYPDDSRLKEAVRAMAAVIHAKCSDGKRVKMGAAPHQLAALADAVAP